VTYWPDESVGLLIDDTASSKIAKYRNDRQAVVGQAAASRQGGSWRESRQAEE